jgi:DNA-binding transcriptional ArsR family regulator
MTERLTDPRAMRALAHAARLEILLRLQADGPATATEVAEQAGVTPSAASYHLRMLAKYGLTEDAPARRDGRERVWRARDRGLGVRTEPDDPPEVKAAKEALIDTVYDSAHRELRRAMGQVDREPEEWRDASAWRRWQLLVTAEEMKRLDEQVQGLLAPYKARTRDSAPDGARVAGAQFTLYLRPEPRPHGLPTEDHDAL